MDTNSDEYNEFYQYAINYLEVSYSFEKDFFNYFCNFENRSRVNLKNIKLHGLLDDESKLKASDNYNLYYEDSFKFPQKYSTEAQVGPDFLNKITNKIYTADKWNEILEGKSITMSFENYLGDSFTYEFKELKCNDKHQSFFIGKQALHDLLKMSIKYYGGNVYDKSKAKELYKKYYNGQIRVNLSKITGAETLSSFFSSYSDLFKFISFVVLICSVVLFFYISYDSVKRKKYEIGILKAFGASSRNLYSIFLINLFFEIVFSLIFYTILINIFTVSCNNILITALIEKTNYGELYNNVVVFNLTKNIVIVDLLIMCVCFLIGAIVPLLKIKNIKPIDIIRNKY